MFCWAAVLQKEDGGAAEVAVGFGKGIGGIIYYPLNGAFAVVGELADGLWNTPEVLICHGGNQ
jgi:hypothetical protein